jgi:hypothetical protein
MTIIKKITAAVIASPAYVLAYYLNMFVKK